MCGPLGFLSDLICEQEILKNLEMCDKCYQKFILTTFFINLFHKKYTKSFFENPVKFYGKFAKFFNEYTTEKICKFV